MSDDQNTQMVWRRDGRLAAVIRENEIGELRIEVAPDVIVTALMHKIQIPEPAKLSSRNPHCVVCQDAGCEFC